MRAARRALLILVVAWTAALGGSALVAAQAGCTFTLGFRALRDQIPDIVGDCLEEEHFEPSTGNTLQRTTGGLLVWRKADNWTAFTDGTTTWINGPSGLASRPNEGPLFPWEGPPVVAPVPVSQLAPAQPAPPPPSTAESADQVLDELKSRGLPIGESITYTAENDPNNLLGRPNGYTSKVNFRDTRLKTNRPASFNTDDGGSIEFFPTPAGATARAAYLASIGQALSMLGEYDYVRGRIILRLSKRLTPSQAGQYEAALNQLPG